MIINKIKQTKKLSEMSGTLLKLKKLKISLCVYVCVVYAGAGTCKHISLHSLMALVVDLKVLAVDLMVPVVNEMVLLVVVMVLVVGVMALVIDLMVLVVDLIVLVDGVMILVVDVMVPLA